MKNLSNTLIKKYWGEEKSTIKIAKEMCMSKGWVIKKMKKFEIPRRNLSEATKIRMREINFDTWKNEM